MYVSTCIDTDLYKGRTHRFPRGHLARKLHSDLLQFWQPISYISISISMYLHISTRFYIKDSPFPARLFGAKLHCSSTVLATYTIYIYIYIYIYICVCVCVCVCVCARARARVCVCMCVYVAQYMYTVLCKGLAVSRAVIWRESSTVTFCNLENIYNIYIYIYIYI